MGMSNAQKAKFATLDEQAHEMFKQGRNITEIALELGTKRQHLSRRLKEKYGITVLSDGRKYIDETFFDAIDTAEKAYWLGFMYADGYVSDSNNIELCLKESDRDHLEKFKACLNSGHKIGKKNITLFGDKFVAYRISIRNTPLSDALKKHGCVPRKSLIVRYPEIPGHLHWHFIRGVFDGDGCLYYSRKSYNVEFSSGSREFLVDLKSVMTQYGVNSKIYSGRTCYTLRVHDRTVTELTQLIYQDAHSPIWLDRKQHMYSAVQSQSH